MSTRRKNNRALLVPAFSEANLHLKLLGGALDTRNQQIFQLDINRSDHIGEYFRIWPGDRKNRIEVLSTDRSVRQLVLSVEEERRLPGQVVRQGEWFFLPLTEEEEEELASFVERDPRVVKRSRSVGPGGTPHIADEVVAMERRHRGKRRSFTRQYRYARGTVAQPNHRPLVLSSWRRVVRNLELNATRTDRVRMQWID